MKVRCARDRRGLRSDVIADVAIDRSVAVPAARATRDSRRTRPREDGCAIRTDVKWRTTRGTCRGANGRRGRHGSGTSTRSHAAPRTRRGPGRSSRRAQQPQRRRPAGSHACAWHRPASPGDPNVCRALHCTARLDTDGQRRFGRSGYSGSEKSRESLLGRSHEPRRRSAGVLRCARVRSDFVLSGRTDSHLRVAVSSSCGCVPAEAPPSQGEGRESERLSPRQEDPPVSLSPIIHSTAAVRVPWRCGLPPGSASVIGPYRPSRGTPRANRPTRRQPCRRRP